MISLKKITLICSKYNHFTWGVVRGLGLWYPEIIYIKPMILYSGLFIDKIIFFRDWIKMMKINIESVVGYKLRVLNALKKSTITLSSSDNCIYVNKMKFDTYVKKLEIPYAHERHSFLIVTINIENYNIKIKTLLLCLKTLKMKIPKEIIFMIIDFVMK